LTLIHCDLFTNEACALKLSNYRLATRRLYILLRI